MRNYSTNLVLHVKQEYFDAIKAGNKKEEYRLDSPYWEKRIVERSFILPGLKIITILCGYPRKDKNIERKMIFWWNGFSRKIITHPHFGSKPVAVLAIDLTSGPIGHPVDII